MFRAATNRTGSRGDDAGVVRSLPRTAGGRHSAGGKAKQAAGGRHASSPPPSSLSRPSPEHLLWLALAFGAGMMVQNVLFGMVGPSSFRPQQAPQPKIPSAASAVAANADRIPRRLDPPLSAPAASPSRPSAASSPLLTHPAFPDPLQRVLDRARFHASLCNELDGAVLPAEAGYSKSAMPVLNNHTAHLPPFGVVRALEEYKASVTTDRVDIDKEYPYQCQLPPEYECDETQFTVVFMAYNPDRLSKMYNQILKFVTDRQFEPVVREVIVVWNGARAVEETSLGKALVDLTRTEPVRISYPLRAGFPNDLMNRYHPRLDVKTKAVMYYDDDGPFYSYKATLAGFELWKRNANAQIGAMARKLDPDPRQHDERTAVLNGPGDRFFVSHCNRIQQPPANANDSPYVGDQLRYNYNEFANFGANMVLPSGSFLHVNYLCYIWHPAFAEIRQYVKDHPVNPDDGTVSMIVSQLSGRAPKVYSRRIKDADQNTDGRTQRRRLSSAVERFEDAGDSLQQDGNESAFITNGVRESTVNHRRLMDGIDWDRSHPHQNDKKNLWGRLRSDVANSLARYFGSVNSGSIGWCYGTQYVDRGGVYCKPEMAKEGMLPWMNPDHTPRARCP